MVSVKSFLAAAAAAAISTAAYAADMPLPPPPQIQYQPVQVIEAPIGRWYLRGDVGVGVQSFSEFDHSQTNFTYVWPPSWQIVQQEIQDTSIFGFGVGYEMNNWLRFDVTGEYRTKAAFKVTGSYTDFCAAGFTCFDVNSGNFSSAVFLANLCRSWHLVVSDALYRRRRWQRTQYDQWNPGQRHCQCRVRVFVRR
jgi:opacity protein-like surface antigen